MNFNPTLPVLCLLLFRLCLCAAKSANKKLQSLTWLSLYFWQSLLSCCTNRTVAIEQPSGKWLSETVVSLAVERILEPHTAGGEEVAGWNPMGLSVVVSFLIDPNLRYILKYLVLDILFPVFKLTWKWICFSGINPLPLFCMVFHFKCQYRLETIKDSSKNYSNSFRVK